jgi:hypothetical protein
VPLPQSPPSILPSLGPFHPCFLLDHTLTHFTPTLTHTLHTSMSTFQSPCTSTLKMEVAQYSRTLVSNHHTTWCNNPKNYKLYSYLLFLLYSGVIRMHHYLLITETQMIIQFIVVAHEVHRTNENTLYSQFMQWHYIKCRDCIVWWDSRMAKESEKWERSHHELKKPLS